MSVTSLIGDGAGNLPMRKR